MMAPPLDILPIGRTNARAAAEALTAAFADDPLVRRICPDTASHSKLITPVFYYSANLSIHYGQAFAAPAADSPLPAGVSLWLDSKRMSCPPWSWWAFGGSRVGHGMGQEEYRLLNEVSALIDRQRDSVAPRHYLYLASLGVRAPYRRLGIATALVAEPMARAARQGLPVLVETNTEGSLRFYEAVGFRVLREFTVRGMGYWVMGWNVKH